MRSLGAGWTRLLLVMLAACPLLAVAAQGERPKIAVVLSGGGAKGSAHIGILKVLEQKRIPVDIIVGTSMGSYVAGMYAMGLSAEEVERTTLAIDWNKGYQDKVGRDELS
ncbi:MAG: patatin-like phospholipase family protein, partial [Aeromonas veronii]